VDHGAPIATRLLLARLATLAREPRGPDVLSHKTAVFQRAPYWRAGWVVRFTVDLRGRKWLERVVAPSLFGFLVAISGCSLPSYGDYAGGNLALAGASGIGGDAGPAAMAGAAGDTVDAGASQGGGGLAGGVGLAGGGVGLAGGGSSAGSGGATSACVPSSKDSACDGLDASCKPTLTESVCPSRCKGVRYSGKSYMGCAVSASFADAEVLCQRQGMDLVQIDSASENNFVTLLAQSLGSYVWIGGSDLEQLGTFSWVRGVAFYQNGPVGQVYENFDMGEPSTSAGQNCVHLHDVQPGHWSTTRCSDSQQFICEVP
jgi:hypothetical protein